MLTIRRVSMVVVCAFWIVSLGAAVSRSALAEQVPDLVLTEKNNGDKVSVQVGDVIAVHLAGNVRGGSGWVLRRISNRNAKLLGAVVSSAATRAGLPGHTTADFQALQPGIVKIELTYVGRAGATSRRPQTVSYTFDVAHRANASQSLSRSGQQPIRREKVVALPQVPVALSLAPPLPVGQDTGAITYDDGSTYRGGVVRGARSGYGTLTFTTNTGNVASEAGYWNGNALSNGTVVMRDGVQYFGNLDADGQLDGQGRFEYPDGTTIASVFQAGSYSGPTTWSFPADSARPIAPSKMVVQVDPPSLSPTGAATETFSDGYTLVGKLENGQFEGPATYSPPSGPGYSRNPIFKASFKGGVLQGPFVSTASDGTQIAGTIDRGSMQGPAVLSTPGSPPCRGTISSTGDFYGFAGAVDEQGFPNGLGTAGCPGDDRLAGRFSHGKMVGIIVDRANDGVVYRVDVGQIPTDRLIGAARIKLANGDVARGRLDGDGALTGRGSYLDARNNVVQNGRWKNGTLVVDRGP